MASEGIFGHKNVLWQEGVIQQNPLKPYSSNWYNLSMVCGPIPQNTLVAVNKYLIQSCS